MNLSTVYILNFISIRNTSFLKDYKNDNWKTHLTYINGTYTVPIIGLTGAILNAITLSILLNPSLRKKNKYNFITAKVINDFIGSLIGIGFKNYHTCLFEKFIYFNNCTESYSLVHSIFKIYVYSFIGYPVYLLSGILNTCIAYERYLTIKSKLNWFNNKGNFKRIVCSSVVLLLVLFVPILFAFRIIPSGNQIYHVQLTEYGETKYFILYIANVVGLGCLANLIVFVSINVITFKKYKEFLKKNDLICTVYVITSRLKKQIKKIKFEIDFLKMAFLLTSIFFMSRFFDFIGFLCASIHYRFKIINNDFLILVANIIFMLVYIEMGINFFILFRFNTRFRQKLLKVFGLYIFF